MTDSSVSIRVHPWLKEVERAERRVANSSVVA